MRFLNLLVFALVLFTCSLSFAQCSACHSRTTGTTVSNHAHSRAVGFRPVRRAVGGLFRIFRCHR